MSDEPPNGAGRRLLSRQLADQLRAEMDQGNLKPGEQLPSYRDLAATRNIAIGTAREAVRLLEYEGRVEIRHGSGAYVRAAHADTADDRLREARAELAEVRSQLKALEQRVSRVIRLVQPGTD